MPTPAPAGGRILTTADRDARKNWIDANPLRAWRHAHTPKLTILEAAGRIGVGSSMVQMYERGVHKPGPDRGPAIAALLGTDWSTRWDDWLAAEPA